MKHGSVRCAHCTADIMVSTWILPDPRAFFHAVTGLGFQLVQLFLPNGGIFCYKSVITQSSNAVVCMRIAQGRGESAEISLSESCAIDWSSSADFEFKKCQFFRKLVQYFE